MYMKIVGYRPMSDCEVQEPRVRFSRRVLLGGLTSLPLAATLDSIYRPAAAQGPLLAYVNFASAVIEFAQKVYEVYSKVITHPEVINPSNNVENRALLGTVRNSRGLVIRLSG